MPYVDVCIANEEDAKDVFCIEAENTDINAGKLDHQGYISVAKQLCDRSGFKKVAITLRGSISANDNDWAAMLYENGEAVFSPTYRIHIVDRVGGGDSFGGGLIYTQLVGKNNQDADEHTISLYLKSNHLCCHNRGYFCGCFCVISLQEKHNR